MSVIGGDPEGEMKEESRMRARYPSPLRTSIERTNFWMGVVSIGLLIMSATTVGFLWGEATTHREVADAWWAYCVELWDGNVRDPKRQCREHFFEELGFVDPKGDKR